MSKSPTHNTLTEKHFQELFYKLYPRLVGYSLSYINDEQKAEDIVENVFVKLWDDREKFTDILNLKAYLYTMVRNATWKKVKQDSKFYRLDQTDNFVLSDEDNEKIIEEEAYGILLNALQSLPEGCKKVFELSCIEELKYKDVAKKLNITVNTVKSQRARAIKLLRNKLKEQDFILFILSIN